MLSLWVFSTETVIRPGPRSGTALLVGEIYFRFLIHKGNIIRTFTVMSVHESPKSTVPGA